MEEQKATKLHTSLSNQRNLHSRFSHLNTVSRAIPITDHIGRFKTEDFCLSTRTAIIVSSATVVVENKNFQNKYRIGW